MTTSEWIEQMIDQYIGLFAAISEKLGDDTAALAIVDQIGKHLRMAEMRARNSTGGIVVSHDGEDQPATTKQLAYLKRLGVEVPESISKQSASAMLDEALAQ